MICFFVILVNIYLYLYIFVIELIWYEGIFLVSDFYGV